MSSPCGSAAMKSFSSAVAIAFSRSSSVTVLLKAMFSRSVRLKIDRVLEHEADLLVQRRLVVVVDVAAVVLDASGRRARAGRSAG